MIDVKELRIGNLINSEEFNAPAYIKVDLEIMGRLLIKDDCYNLQPIPITEELLLKLGFQVFPWGWVKLSKNDFGFRLNLGNTIFHYEISGNYPVKIKYLHQLQNLYFDLTREELNLNNYEKTA